MKKIWLLAAACFSFNSWAAEKPSDLWIVSTVKSYHFNRDISHNEFNRGIGLEYHLTPKVYLLAGEYDNSYKVHSNYFGTMYMPFSYKNFKFGGMGVFLNGYKENPQAYLFSAAPMISFEYKQVGVNLMVLVPPKWPFDGESGPKPKRGVLGLQLKYNF